MDRNHILNAVGKVGTYRVECYIYATIGFRCICLMANGQLVFVHAAVKMSSLWPRSMDGVLREFVFY
ncbi:uncharacterized protein Dvar_74930 [Desulfosarcina variabilis str. Montpellier]